MKKIQTYLSNSEALKFEALRQKLNMSQYELAREAILMYINEPEPKEKMAMHKFIEWLKCDLLFKPYPSQPYVGRNKR